MEGVGQGALAAAAKHGSVDVAALVGGKWESGKPVPFEFLAVQYKECCQEILLALGVEYCTKHLAQIPVKAGGCIESKAVL